MIKKLLLITILSLCIFGKSTAQSLTVSAGSTVTISASSFTGYATVTIQGSALLVVTGTVTLNGGTSISVIDNGALVINGDLSLGGSASFSLSGNGTMTINGNLDGSGNITISDAGGINVSGNATFSGSSAIAGSGSLNVSGTVSTSGSSTIFGSTGSCTNCTVSNTSQLPIELLSFTAAMNGEKVDIEWSTITETNNAYFTIEKSQNGKDFIKVVDVTGAGNSTTQRNYLESDYQPFGGTSYYRLKQTDKNGASKTFWIAVVTNTKRNLTFYPNPITKNQDLYVNLEGSKKGEEMLVVIRNVQGEEFYSKAFVYSQDDEVLVVTPSSTIPPGNYLVVASSNNKFYSQKIVVK
jgi:hypothetical protein